MFFLELSHIQCQFPSFSLAVEHLFLKTGECMGLLGHSGSGKSTLLKTIAGFITLQGGDIKMEGESITKRLPHERNLGFVFQEPVLLPYYSIQKNLECLLDLKKVPKKEWSKRIHEVLSLTHTEKLIKRFPENLSGGEKQRVAISAALLFSPKLLLLDEPFTALDPHLRLEQRQMLMDILKERNISSIFVTHDVEEALISCSNLALMHEGKILQTGAVKELYEKPQSLFVAKYFGLEGILTGIVRDSVFVSGDIKCEVPFPDLDPAQILIAPHAISLSSEGSQGNRCEVKNSLYIGGQWKTQLTNSLIMYTQEQQTGRIFIRINPQKIHLFEQ